MLGLVLGVVAFPVVCSAGLDAAIDSVKGKLVTVGVALVALMVVVAGILFVTSAGDAGRLTTAKSTLLWAILGGIVIAAVAVIVDLTKV